MDNKDDSKNILVSEKSDNPAGSSQLLLEENQSNVKLKREESLRSLRSLTGFLVERKLSQEELEERLEWIQTKRLKSNYILKERNHVIRKVYFPDIFNGLYSAKFSPDGQFIATTYGSGCIQLRNADTAELKATIRTGLESSPPVTCCRFNPVDKNILYASSACGNIFICDVDKIEFSKFAEELNNEISVIDIDLNGKQLASGGKDAGLRIYDVNTSKLIATFKKDKNDLIIDNALKFHSMKIFAVKYNKLDPNIIVTGGWDETVKIWDTRIGNGCIMTMIGPHICGDAIDIRDNKILTGSWVVRDSLQLWDMRSGKLIETIKPKNRETSLAGEFLYSAQFFDGDPYGKYVIVGGSATGCVEVINLKEKEVVSRFCTNKAIITIDSYKTNIVFGGMDSIISLVDYNF